MSPRKLQYSSVIYCDYTASARAFRSIENYIHQEVLPFYGNTHSSVTVTAEQTTLFMHEARQEIRAMTGCGDQDSVIFTGSGSTCAVELLVHLMQCGANTIIVHSCQEHHSNLLPWRTIAKECFCVNELETGQIDLVDLQHVLTKIKNKFGDINIIGTFSACSNLTGIVVDVQRVTETLKKLDYPAYISNELFFQIWCSCRLGLCVCSALCPDRSKRAVFFGCRFFLGAQIPRRCQFSRCFDHQESCD